MEEDHDLYIVKTVFCIHADYKVIRNSVRGDDTDKFGVVKIIGLNSQVISYKQKN